MKALAAIGGAMLLAFGATQADATIYLALQAAGVNNGAITVVASSTNGRLAYSDVYGAYDNTITAQGFPVRPQPELQTGSINSTASVAGKLTVYIVQDGLNSYNGSLMSSFTANSFMGAAQSIVETTYYSTGNSNPTSALFDPGTQLATTTFSAIGSRSFTNNGLAITGPFSTTSKYEITFNGGGSTNGTINLAGAVPEPATWALMLAGFGFIGASLRQRRRATVSFG